MITGVRIEWNRLQSADIVILAAGAGTAALAASVGVTVPLEPSPALLAHFRAPGRLIVYRVVINPDLEVRQISDDVIVAAAAYIDDSAENGPDAVARPYSFANQDQVFDGGENVQSRPGAGRPPPDAGRWPSDCRFRTRNRRPVSVGQCTPASPLRQQLDASPLRKSSMDIDVRYARHSAVPGRFQEQIS